MHTKPISPLPRSEEVPASPRLRRRYARNFLIMLSPLILLFGTGCFCLSSTYPFSVTQRIIQTPDAELGLWLDVFAAGVYTPTADGRVILDGQTTPAAIDLDELAVKGYVAVRVPHAPPTYTTSILQAGFTPGAPGARFTYFLPPSSEQPVSVPVTLTRHISLEQSINTRFPITDGASHWEVWWLAEGGRFPIPAEPFRLDGALSLEFKVNFGADSAATCHGCPYEYLIFDGATLHGPFGGTVIVDTPTSTAAVRFGSECNHQTPSIPTVAGVLLTPSQPFTLTYCLENYDNRAHTFAITANSEQAWAYTFYTQTVGAAPVRVGDAPFQVRASGKGQFFPGMIAIHAVFTPTFAVDANINESLELRATSLESPAMTTTGAAFGASPGFTPAAPEEALYLPIITGP
jgi:hypothetical protein